MSAVIYPSKKRLSDLKTNILRTAQTSHFQAWFTPPDEVRKWMSQKSAAGIGKKFTNAKDEFYSLMCSDATLPGSTLATHEQVNDFTGVTERHAYRRQYDERSEFSFYVDKEYDVITFFENWMSFIVNEQLVQGLEKTNYSYRVNFPEEYQTKIFINKFEKDYSNRMLTYQFINAFPLSINSIPVSYNASEILRVTVSFSYSRYIVSTTKQPTNTIDLLRPNGETIPEFRIEDGRPTLAQLAEQLEQRDGRTFGPNILGGQQTQ